jgi:preprotein translocase subunit SecA
MAQRDPLVEYQREGFQLFEAMNESIKEESVGYLFNVQVDVDGDQAAAAQAPAVQPMSVSDMLAGSGLSNADAPAEAESVDALASAASEPAPARVASAGAADGLATAAVSVEKHPTFRAKGLEQPERRPQQLQYSAPGETGEVEHRAAGSASDTLSEDQLKGVSRNGPCPCGSGKKFKMCHGRA